MSFIKELRRRNVLRVALAYAAAAWVLIEVMDLVTGIYEAPTWVMKVLVGAVLIGVVPVMILSWVYQITAEGVRKDDADEPAHVPATGRQLNIAMVVMFAVAIGFFVAGRLSRDIGDEQVTARDGPPMVAVLPFAAVGGGEDSIFFAAGVHDDLLTQLAQQPSMRVISRTSVLEYKDTQKNIREIGEELRADAILEGGVQSAGDRIRINAQLIDARTDEHLWAETFDRELTASNIFDVQTEIARAIASALHGTLGEPTVTGSGSIPTTSMAAYRLYHEALAMRDSRFDATSYQAPSHEEYRGLLREAAELDPAYTRPQAELVGSLAVDSLERENQASMAEAEQVLANIAAVAPGSADHLIAQAYYTYYIIGDYDLAHEVASQAQTLKPSDARLAEMKSWIERRQGDYDAMIESQRLARALDPRNPRWASSIVFNLTLTHRYDEAWAEYETIDEPGYGMRVNGAVLRMREHRDFGRLAADLQALYDEFDGAFPIQNLAWFRIANREYAVAAELLDQIPDPVERVPWAMGIPDKTLLELQIRWFLGQSDRLKVLVSEARASLENRVSDGFLGDARAMLGAAYLAAVQGDTAETVPLVRGWNREGASKDPPERAFRQDSACQVLGMAGAADAAVACIRTGLAKPSMVTPFMEPYLPYYDSIRDEPVFVELLAELDNAAKSP
jgi:TolB-like protein